jgi:hypothetical protein
MTLHWASAWRTGGQAPSSSAAIHSKLGHRRDDEQPRLLGFLADRLRWTSGPNLVT